MHYQVRTETAIEWTFGGDYAQAMKSRVPIVYLHRAFHAFQAFQITLFLWISTHFCSGGLFKSSLPQTSSRLLEARGFHGRRSV
jgi:hypothetical protein